MPLQTNQSHWIYWRPRPRTLYTWHLKRMHYFQSRLLVAATVAKHWQIPHVEYVTLSFLIARFPYVFLLLKTLPHLDNFLRFVALVSATDFSLIARKARVK